MISGLQLELCRQHIGPAYYQKLAGGEAVVWLMIPIEQLHTDECVSTWGLNPKGYIVVSSLEHFG